VVRRRPLEAMKGSVAVGVEGRGDGGGGDGRSIGPGGAGNRFEPKEGR
jgi:hypothetical protein